MTVDYLFIGGEYHGKRISVGPRTAIYKVNGLNSVQTYARNWFARKVWDYSTKPPTTFMQRAFFFYPTKEYPTASECEALLLPSDWQELEGSRRVIEQKEAKP